MYPPGIGQALSGFNVSKYAQHATCKQHSAPLLEVPSHLLRTYNEAIEKVCKLNAL